MDVLISTRGASMPASSACCCCCAWRCWATRGRAKRVPAGRGGRTSSARLPAASDRRRRGAGLACPGSGAAATEPEASPDDMACFLEAESPAASVPTSLLTRERPWGRGHVLLKLYSLRSKAHNAHQALRSRRQRHEKCGRPSTSLFAPATSAARSRGRALRIGSASRSPERPRSPGRPLSTPRALPGPQTALMAGHSGIG